MDKKREVFLMLQLCDSAFPTGGFSHSNGTEAAFQRSFIKSKEDLKIYILGCLENAGASSITFVKAAYEAFDDIERLKALDQQHNANLLNHVSHRASKQQGRSFINTSCEVFPCSSITNLKSLIEEDEIQGHLAIVFGVVCAALQIPDIETVGMFMFNSLRTIIASVVRLGKLGAIEAQRYQFEVQSCLDDIISRNWDVKPDEASVIFPLSEVLQNSHDTMFSKLFFS